jgi:hypothetical protein
MKSPRVVVWAFDDWLAAQLHEAVSERRWLLHSVRSADGWASAAGGGPCVAVVQVDPTADSDRALSAVADLHRTRPDADVVVVCDAKLNEDDRPVWTAAALDLGARLVLYPPLTKTVLEDAVLGLLECRVGSPPPPPPEKEIDLAAGNFEAE